MRWITIIVILLFFTILDSGNISNYISVSQLNIKPEILIILLAFLSSKLEGRDCVLASFLIGFMADVSSTTIGPAILAYGIAGYGFSNIKDVLVLNRMRYQAITVFLLAVVVISLVEALTYFKIHQASPSIIMTVLGKSLYTALLAPFVWKFLQLISFLFGVKPSDSRRRR